MTQPPHDLDGRAIYTDLLNIEKEAADLKELEIKLQVLIAGIRQGKFNISRPTPSPLCDSTDIPTQNEFIAEFVGSAERKRKEHDAATAAQAREKVLGELETLAEKCRWQKWCTDYMNKPCKKPCDFYRAISAKKALESLRTKEPRP